LGWILFFNTADGNGKSIFFLVMIKYWRRKDSEVVTSTPHTCSDYSVRETLIKIESSMLEMKVNYEKEQSVLNDKIDNLYKNQWLTRFCFGVNSFL
jgi:hypothetical protein